jgi:hypothetical protein
MDEIVRFIPSTQDVSILTDRLPTGRSETSAAWTGLEALIFGGLDSEEGYSDQILRFRPIEACGLQTPPGSSIFLDLGESVSVMFGNVRAGGSTSIQQSTSPPIPQSGFDVNGVYTDIITTAAHSGLITVSLPYDPESVSDPSSLRLYHFDQALGTWFDVTTDVDMQAHLVTGVVSSLSWFGVGTPVLHFSGFLQPINNDGTSIFKLKRTIPVKFQLTEGNGEYVTDIVAHIYLSYVSSGVTGTEREADSNDQSDSGNTFRYDHDANQYIFNLGTKNLSQGTWRIRASLDNGLSYTVLISLTAK